MRTAIISLIVVASLLGVGELAVQAMDAPTVLPHSVAHVMGFSCKNKGPQGPAGPAGPVVNAAREPNSAGDDSPGYVWRLKDQQRPNYFWRQDDPTLGIVEYLNRTDCERAALLVNARFLLPQFVCVIVQQ